MTALRIVLLCLAIAVTQLATSLYLPSLPAMAQALGVGPAAASGTLTAFFIGFAVSNLVAGPLADWRGRRAVMLAGMAVYAGGTLLCAVASSIGLFLAGRLIQAAGASAAPVVARAMLRDGASGGDATRAMVWISLAMAVSPALGPPLGGVIQQAWGWRAVFWVLLALGGGMLAVLVPLLEETLPPARRVRPLGLPGRFAALLRDGAYVRHVAALSCLFAGLGVFFAAGPFLFIQRLGYSPVGYGLLNMVNVAGYLVGSTAAARLAPAWGPVRLVRWGTAVALAGGVAVAGLAGVGAFGTLEVLVPIAVLVGGFGMVFPAATAGALARHPSQAGLASALLGFLQISAAAAGTAAVGPLLAHGFLPTALVFFALSLLAFLAARGLRQ